MIRWLTLALLLSASPLYAAPDVDPTQPPFKAVCDGVADDTAKLQAAILYADTPPFKTIRLPPSLCRTTDTLTFGNQPTRYSEISVYGHSEYVSGISYAGPADRPAIAIRHMSAFRWSRFAVTRAGVRGSTIGIYLDGPVGSNTGGTMNTTITFEHINASGFYAGIMAGGYDAASELDCRQCGFANNDIGFTSVGYNSLNFWFFGSHFGQNGIGIKMGGPWVSESVHVVGGDSNGNGTDFWCGNTFGVLSIQDFRSELNTTGRFLDGGGYLIAIRTSTIHGPATLPVIIADSVQSLSIADSFITGQIRVATAGEFSTAISLERVIVSEGTPGWPLLLPSSNLPNGLYLDLRLNTRQYGPVYPNFSGRY